MNKNQNNLILLEDLGMLFSNEASKKKKRFGLYKCFCGNEFKVRIESVKANHTKSCGCLHKERAIQSNLLRGGNLIGVRFGKLTVIKEIGFKVDLMSQKRKRVYLCLCDCGNYCFVQHQYLNYGDTSSCGCLNSKGEMQVEKFLQERGINYKKQFQFENLKDKNYLKFDFAVFNKQNKLIKLIEIDGLQHYDENNRFFCIFLLTNCDSLAFAC